MRDETKTPPPQTDRETRYGFTSGLDATRYSNPRTTGPCRVREGRQLHPSTNCSYATLAKNATLGVKHSTVHARQGVETRDIYL